MSAENLNILDDLKANIDFVAETIINEFNKPLISNIFFINLDYLKTKSDLVDFKSEYNYSPQKVCIDYYNNKNYYPIILLVNNCKSIFEFNDYNYKKVMVPSLNAIVEVINSSQS